MQGFHRDDGRMFLGTLDDSVSRYPWDRSTLSINNFNHLLIYYAIIGPKICCRIGNILYNKTLFPGVLDELRSPFVAFAGSGFLQLQMRGESINDAIAIRQRIRTNSTMDFITRFGWAPDSEMFNRLQDFDKSLEVGIGKITYNPDFSARFRELSARIRTGTPDEYQHVFETWARRFEGEKRTRSNFERTCEALYPDNYSARRRAMSVINSVNHYAYGLEMRKLISHPFIETKELWDLRGQTKNPFGDQVQIQELARLEEMVRRGVFSSIRRNLKIPRALFDDPETWDTFSRLVLSSRGPHHDNFVRAKQNFVLSLRKCFIADDIEAAKAQLGDACLAYSDFLNKALGVRLAPFSSLRFKLFARKIFRKSAGMATETVEQDVTDGFGELLGGTYARIGFKLVVSMVKDEAETEVANGIRRSVDEFQATHAAGSDEADAFLAHAFMNLCFREIHRLNEDE